MKKLFYLFVLCSSLSNLRGQETINAYNSKKFIGKKVYLCDTVKEMHMGDISMDGSMVLYCGANYDARTFALVFKKNVLIDFSFEPDKKMVNHAFCVRGKILTYRGKPAIYVTSESQLHIPQ